MLNCSLCHFDVLLDDGAIPQSGDRCICLACYARQTGTEQLMPKTLRRELIAALAEVGAA